MGVYTWGDLWVEIDEEWARVLRNEGKKNQRELLIRLSDVKQIKE